MTRLSTLTLFVAVILTGFNAGIGFGNAVGYMPGFEDTPVAHALSYWQHADHYFRARMPVFGNTMLIAMVLSIILLRRRWRELSFWLLVMALCFAVGDLIVILNLNLPLNESMQQLNPETVSSAYFEPLRQNALKAYYLRSVLTIGAFLSVCVTAMSMGRNSQASS